jgi:uncharacterized protein
MTTPTTDRTNATLGTSTTGPLGRIMWHELLTTDQAAAQRFYTSVFGWTTETFPMGDGQYVMWSVGGTSRGGFMPIPEQAKAQGAPQHWLTYFGAPDVDAAAADVEKAGGTIHVKPQDIPGAGRFAVATDPQGAYFALYRADVDRGEPAGMADVGDVSWHELTTPDSVAAHTFYTKLFRWESSGDVDMGGGMIYRMFGRNGVPLGGIYDTPAEMQGVPPNWLPYFRVTDIDDANAKIRANGGTINIESMEVPGGDLISVATDPQGGAFAVHQPKAA